MQEVEERQGTGRLPKVAFFSPEGLSDILGDCTRRRLSANATLALAVLVEYVCAELIEVADNLAQSEGQAKRILPSHLKRAIADDSEFASLCDDLGFAYR